MRKGTVTAGNSSPMSDGAAAAVIMSDARAKSLGLKPLARFVAYATAGCPPEEFGIGPVFAIPKALKLAGLSLHDIAVIELNEAFAAQSLAVIQQAGLDAARVNPNGGAIALGHPLGCTGAKLTATLIRESAAQKRALRHGHHVHRRRHGRRRHLRAAMMSWSRTALLPRAGSHVAVCAAVVRRLRFARKRQCRIPATKISTAPNPAAAGRTLYRSRTSRTTVSCCKTISFVSLTWRCRLSMPPFCISTIGLIWV